MNQMGPVYLYNVWPGNQTVWNISNCGYVVKINHEYAVIANCSSSNTTTIQTYNVWTQSWVGSPLVLNMNFTQIIPVEIVYGSGTPQISQYIGSYWTNSNGGSWNYNQTLISASGAMTWAPLPTQNVEQVWPFSCEEVGYYTNPGWGVSQLVEITFSSTPPPNPSSALWISFSTILGMVTFGFLMN